MKEITIREAAKMAEEIQGMIFGAAEGETHLEPQCITLYSHNKSKAIIIHFEVLNEGAEKIIKKLNSMKPFDEIGCLIFETKDDLETENN